MLWKVKTLLTFKVSFPAAVWSWITFVDLIIYSNIKKPRMKIDISISAQNHDVRSPSYQTHPFINRSKNLSKCNFLWDVWHLIRKKKSIFFYLLIFFYSSLCHLCILKAPPHVFRSAELFFKTFAINSTWDNLGFVSSFSSPSVYIISSIKIFCIGDFYVLSGLNHSKGLQDW